MAFRLIVIGTSLGGLNALRVILRELPPSFPVPIVVVQHRDGHADEAVVRILQNESNLIITEVYDKDKLRDGFVYIAPADYHVLIDGDQLCLSVDPPVQYSRPSIDVLFESAARAKRQQLVCIVLTGANADGAKGLAAVKARGGYTIVQDPKTAEAKCMPEAAIAACHVDQVVPLRQIARVIKHLAFKQEEQAL